MNQSRQADARMLVQPSRQGGSVWFALLVVSVIVAGCKPAEIDTTYGRRRGSPGSASVNGTSVLAKMFEVAGHRVVTWRRLSPKLDQYKSIVWFPDDFAPPTAEQRNFLEKWLGAQPGRTLVYVGRDYDAAIAYWNKIQNLVPPNQAIEVARRLALAQALHDSRRAEMPNGEACDWFVMRRDATGGNATALAGPWATGITVAECELEMAGRLDVPSKKDIDQWMAQLDDNLEGPPTYETLLAANDELAVGRLSFTPWNGSQIIFVINGSFLLNLPLVNHEHRKLADQLITACGSPGRVVFLESGKGGPTVYDKEPGANTPTGFEVFTVWPLGVILVHLTALGILACVTLFPVFGRPRELTQRSLSDFGQHIDALGELLEKTGDREYALQRLQTYHAHVRSDAPSATKTS